MGETQEGAEEMAEAQKEGVEMAAPVKMESTLCHGGRFVRYNICSNRRIVFEVTSKYKPPIIPLRSDPYSVTWSALNSETGEQVAIRKISHDFDNMIYAKRTLREVKLLRHMDHENVLAIRDIIPPPQWELFNDVYIAYELMETNLHQIIHSNQPLSEEHIQILRGLKYIHSASVLHLDLQPSNILLNANCDLKICDFGFEPINSAFIRENFPVTKNYRAPELLFNSSGYTAAIDVWSVGCIFMELMERKPLFPGKNIVHQMYLLLELIGTPKEDDLGFLDEVGRRSISRLPCYSRQSFAEKFPQMHRTAIDLLEKMLTFNPSQRITVEDALAHPYFASLHDTSDEPVCMKPFSFDFEKHVLTGQHVKELIYQEALALNPEYQT
ncbi:mitogen-activated protein kinase homolog MMK1-like isoform X2 [Dioscorea cayenensis subsp. rotundata]|uniref:Mitogen-activated protein kinase homolog MMK1-like isoform X2 n=1 Tax=Dioscorea cayennensis subsp. rotundata TaxID=55577 RepID=A0AB40AYR4_DIOCR|nr:mitogen-activated protein kinase homolog MMK1-like isoform X2 [Dioscorea cayenensis subsp. rotundata]